MSREIDDNVSFTSGLDATRHTMTDSTEETPWTIPPTNGK